MNINLGTLNFLPAKDHPELMSPVVYDALVKIPEIINIGAAEVDPDFSDTGAFCSKYSVGMDKTANCVILEAKRADKIWYASCLIFGNTRADINGLARRTLDARKVSFAPMEKAVELSKMEYGAITPIGLPQDWSILIDKAVIDTDYVIVGSGIRKTKLAIPGKLFASLPSTQILEGLAKVVENS